MKIILGSDHGGYELKEQIKEYLAKRAVALEDAGIFAEESVDYPDYAKAVAEKVQTGDTGILICGTGIGMCIAANKFKGVRAALCYDSYTARMAREHNDANVLCLGGRTTKADTAKEIVDVFLDTEHSDESRHQRRVEKISVIEKNNFK